MLARNKLIGLAILGAALTSATPLLAENDPTGIWLDEDGRGAIEIKPCGKSMCGHVVWTRSKTDSAKGCGRQIIGNVASIGGGLWDNGWIYSPERGKKYDVELKPLGSGKLRVKGYAGSKLFSKTMIWTAAPPDLVRCDAKGEEILAKGKAPAETKAKSEVAAAAEKAKPAEKTAATPDKAKPDEAKTALAKPIVPPKPVPAVRPAPKAAPAETETPKNEAAAQAAPGTQSGDAPATEDAAAAPAEEGVANAGEPAAEDAAPEASDAPAEQDIAELEDAPSLGRFAAKLRELERETGYGVKETGDGDCSLKVPFVTVRFPCKK